ncbi:MAG: beta-propeller fold lactonase family protein [Gammaproteobacteria bacterium]|nr:beta-propeller fold lactonase family protein [Gammaproteobacteria bacterium]
MTNNKILLLFLLLCFTGSVRALSFFEVQTNNVGSVTGLRGASAVAISKLDGGKSVYAAGFVDNTVAVFNHMPEYGILNFIETHKHGTGGVDGLLGPRSLALSPDEKNVYAAAFSSGAVVVFSRNTDTGNLTFVEAQKDGIDGSDSLAGASSIVVSPDGTRVYVSATLDNAITVFSRDNATGKLSDPQSQQNGIDGVTGLSGASAVTVSPDNLYIYVAASLDNALTVFSPVLGGGMAFVQSYQNGGNAGGKTISGLGGAYDASLSADGQHLYATGDTSNAVAAFATAADGSLRFIASYENGTGGVEGLDRPRAVTVSPDGNKVYAVGANSNSVVEFDRDSFMGALSFVGAFVNGIRNIDGIASPTDVAVSADSSRVYVTGSSSNALASFEIFDTDLMVSMSASPPQAGVNTRVTYQVTIRNNGPSQAAEVVLTDTLPASVTYESATPTAGTCSLTGSEILCSIGTLDVGEEASAAIVVTPTQPGELTNTVQVASAKSDSNPDNDSASETVSVVNFSTDLAVLSANTNGEIIDIAQPLIYTVVIANQGNDPAANVVLSNTFTPANSVLYLSAFTTAPGAPNPNDACIQDTGSRFSCELGTLDAFAESVTLEVALKPLAGGLIENLISLAADANDPASANNSKTVSVTVTGEPSVQNDLAVSLTAMPESAIVGNPLTYSVTISNNSSNNATGVVLTATLPAELALASATPSQGEVCTKTGGSVRCELGMLNGGAEATVSISVLPQAAGAFINTVAVDANETDPEPVNNTAAVQSRVNAPQSLAFVASYRSNEGIVKGLDGVIDLAISPDGKHVYTAAFQNNAVAVFRRDPASGDLTFIEMRRNGFEGVTGISGASGVAAGGADGNTVYVSGYNSSTLAAFNRNSDTGSLDIPAQLLSTGTEEGKPPVLVTWPLGVAAAGEFVYVAAFGNNAVSAVRRDPADGSLSFVASYQNGTENIQGLNGVNTVKVSPDGKQVYTVSNTDSALAVFNRDTSTGELTFRESFQNGQQDGAKSVSGLAGASDAAVSADGYIYVAGNTDSAIAIFKRDAAGDVSFVEACCDNQPTLSGVYGVAVHITSFYSTNPDGLSIFARDENSGLLTFQSVLAAGAGGGLSGVRNLEVSSDGEHIYAVSSSENAIVIFATPAADLSVTVDNISPEPGLVGKNLDYIFSVTNNGPHRATGVTLVDTLPEWVRFMSGSVDPGLPCMATGNKIACNIGVIENGSSAVARLTAVPLQEGMLTNAVEVTGNENDPEPSGNSVVSTTQIVDVVDLQMLLRDETDPIRAGGVLTYSALISNAGPGNAIAVTFTAAVPAAAEFVSAIPEQGCAYENGTVTCSLGDLAQQTDTQVSISLKPAEIGTLVFEARVDADQGDSDPANNTAAETTAIISNMIEINSFYDNTGKVLENPAVSAAGEVSGGAVAGLAVNQGRLSNVSILSGTIVSGGGRLSGAIVNQGVIDGALLDAGAIVSNGSLRGSLSGDPADPAVILYAHIETGAQLSHVIIGEGMTLAQGVNIGEGVAFRRNESIPADTELTKALPSVQDPVTSARMVDLNADVVSGGESLLEAINALPVLVNNGLAMTLAENGFLFLSYAEMNYAVQPWQVRQAKAGVPPGITLDSDSNVTFVTASGREVLAMPVLQAPGALQSALTDVAQIQIQIQAETNGNISISGGGKRYIMRPDLAAQALAGTAAPMLTGKPTRFLKAELGGLVFADSEGVVRQQSFHPVPVDIEALRAPEAQSAMLMAMANTGTTAYSPVNFLIQYGEVSFEFLDLPYGGRFAYEVNSGTPIGAAIQFAKSTDENGDGVDDFKVTYANGDQQVIYYLPPPGIETEIERIPGVAEAGLKITSNKDYGTLLITITHESTGLRALLAPGPTEQRPYGSTDPGLNINGNGSIEFIAPSARAMTAWPLVQDANTLLAALQETGFQIFGDGSFSMQIDADTRYVLRPDMLSSLAPSQPLGINATLGFVELVFDDKDKVRRMQKLYPIPADAQALRAYLETETEGTVTFGNTGKISVAGGLAPFEGELDYAVESSASPSDKIQLMKNIVDIDMDGVKDFLVIYPNGESQVIYRLVFTN